MKLRTACFLPIGFSAIFGVASAATIIVNTADNNDVSAGKTNLVTAINLLADGDTIQFNIPGAGPHYLVTPVGGYPVVAPNNVLIDGYSQPGAAPNSNPFLGTNNAALKIVLDSRNGEGTSHPGVGFGDSEIGVLFLVGTNCHVRGLCFLGAGNSGGVTDKAAVNINDTAHGAHVSGCWIGVDVDGVTLHTFDRGPTAFGGVVDGVPSWPIGTVVGVEPGLADTAAARAQQNVIVGSWVNVFLESMDMVIAGNKLNVLPDGMHDVDQNVAPLEAVVETGRVNNNMRVGTDGDGLSDAEERNIFGGVVLAGDNNIIEIYGQNAAVGRCTNIVIAGNYFGVAVDGVTRFTNSMVLVNRFTRRISEVDSDCQFGSDFDGVSDGIEANVIYMNYPFDPAIPVLPRLLELSAEGRMSFRGNVLVNNNLAPFSYADGVGGRLEAFRNYSAPFMDTTSDNPPLPTLDATNSVYPRLAGTFPVGLDPYTNIIIDIYQADPEGWANGKLIAGLGFWFELTDNVTYTNGFPQGRKYVGSRVVANTGTFDVDISDLNLAGQAVTVAVNYSADPPGTTRGRVHTGNFSNPLPGQQVTVTQGEEADLAATYSTNDVIQGLIPMELPGDKGWHSANTDPLDQLPAFTDGQGVRSTGLTGLLNDFPGAGVPAKLIQYELPVPTDINAIRVFTGNNGRDGRVFHTYTVRFSADGAQTFTDPIYVQSHPSGTLNNAGNNQWLAVLSELTSFTSRLATRATHIEFAFYSVDNTGGEMRDPFDGINPFTGADDTLTAAFVSPLVWEIDVLGSDSPPSLLATRSGTDVQFTWLSSGSDFLIQAATRPIDPDWADLAPQPVIQRNGVTNTASIAIESAPRFFRLRQGP